MPVPGIKIIGPGDLTDDDELNNMGDQMLGMVTAHDYSAAHDSALNKKYVEDFKKANNFRPNFVSVGGYDGMHLIYEALKKTGGKTDGDTLHRGHEGHEMGKPARDDVDRSGDPRHRAATSTFARSRRSTASCGTWNSPSSMTSRTR